MDTLVTGQNIGFPACIAFAPDNSGKFFFAEANGGRIRIFDEGYLLPRPFVVLPVKANTEKGVVGIAPHPGYPDSPFVYVSFIRASDGRDVVARYRDSAGIGIRPVTVFTHLPAEASGVEGNIRFGPDGKLYVSYGNGGPSEDPQDTSTTNADGKILRLNPDGSVPPDNPWKGRAFWSIGHRNSNAFAFDKQTGIMYSTGGVPGCKSEVSRVPRGGNLGWPSNFDQATCTYLDKPDCVLPLYDFPASPAPALTGIAVYRSPAFPRLMGKLLFAGREIPSIWSLALTAAGDSVFPNSLETLFTAPAGISDIEVGPEGFLYLACGRPGAGGRILRLHPVIPSFTSTPPTVAVQGVLYSYTPTFDGTPPELSIISGPDGMLVDSTTWTLHWVPTNQEALQHLFVVRLRADNGAGSVDQEFPLGVTNVNDPPGSFELTSPSIDTTLTFEGSDPAVRFAWGASVDPDLDTVGYVLETDTVAMFNSPALRDTVVGTATSKTLLFPRQTARYYWRVKATDGLLTTISSETRRVVVTFTSHTKEQQSAGQESRLEQNFPNPFNPTTSIVYTIPKDGFVRLAVFNLLGQEVALVFEGYQTEGTHEVEFRNSELPSGIYFYRIQAPGLVETRKLTILR